MSTTGKPTTRRDLLYLLAQASELEHSLVCQYLFAAFSLKQRVSEGITLTQLAKIRRWRGQIITIATQEMLHLSLASNLLTAIGGAPYFRRANFPQGKTYTSLSLIFVLAQFSEETLTRFICFELPRDFVPKPGEKDWNRICADLRNEGAVPALLPEPLLPKKLDYHSIGELYQMISDGFAEIEAKLQLRGKSLFIGPRDAQAKGIFVDEGFSPPQEQLIEVTNVASAQAAIELIIEQGEGNPEDDPENNHFRKFIGVLEEYQAAQAEFQPVRPVIGNPLLDLQRDQPGAVSLGANVIQDELARDVMEIFGAVYEVMLQILARYFAHTDEDEEQLYVLKSAFLNLMPFVLMPLGDAITQLPAGIDGMNAGPSFEIFSDVQLLPHKSSAWPYFRERLDEISAACEFVVNNPRASAELKDALGKVINALKKIAYPISFEPNGLTWQNGIKQLFSPMDIDHMRRRALNLDNREEVTSKAASILQMVEEGRMPKAPLGPWSAQRVNIFKQWLEHQPSEVSVPEVK